MLLKCFIFLNIETAFSPCLKEKKTYTSVIQVYSFHQFRIWHSHFYSILHIDLFNSLDSKNQLKSASILSPLQFSHQQGVELRRHSFCFVLFFKHMQFLDVLKLIFVGSSSSSTQNSLSYRGTATSKSKRSNNADQLFIVKLQGILQSSCFGFDAFLLFGKQYRQKQKKQEKLTCNVQN